MGIGMESINPDMDVSMKGIVPRAISAIFDTIKTRKLENDTFESFVTVSFLELYNEELVDLLNPRLRSTPAPVIREDSNGHIIWQNLSEEVVNSVDELMMFDLLIRVLEKGTLNRTTGSTDMNATSSRSHAIFTVTLKQSSTKIETHEDGSESSSKNSFVSKFHFVDLAGSERLKRTNAQGDRKKEGISINQGLLALGNVISALGDESRKSSHVPYRDSKLTRMLQDSLGGNSQTLMLACISPSDLNYGETVNTLHYANRARNIKNRVEVNQEWGSNENQREMKSLRSTISQLRTEIAMIKANGVENNSSICELGSVTNPKQLVYHQRRERDHLSEIECLKAKLSTAIFQKDQFQYLSSRLEGRVRNLLEENMEVAKERDVMLAEKCELLKLVGMDNAKRLRHGDPLGLPKRARSPTQNAENIDEVKQMLGGYIKTIRKLRSQLNEAEDKLAWQHEAMSKLSNRSNSSTSLEWSSFQFDQLGVQPNPVLSVLDNLKANDSKPAFSRQRKILEAMRENIDLKNMDPSMQVDVSQIISKVDHADDDLELGSRLKFSKVDNNDSNEANPETDLFLLINSIQNDISRHENLMEQNLKRENDYEQMQKAYEFKLNDLQEKLSNLQKEKHFKPSQRYDAERLKIDSEISDTKRKLGENHRLRTDNRARNDKLTSELQATISGLKGSKF